MSPEHVDKLMLQDIRSEFYRCNSLFEQVLKFKPIRKVHMSRVEVSLEESYEALKSVSVDEDAVLSFDERIK